jgi:hypothetical protein
MKNNNVVIIIAIIAIIVAIIILLCLGKTVNSPDKKSESFRVRRGNNWGRGRGRGGIWRRPYTRSNIRNYRGMVWPYYTGIQAENTPNYYGECKCVDGITVQDNCKYGSSFCDGDNCICGTGKFYGCGNDQNEWCE